MQAPKEQNYLLSMIEKLKESNEKLTKESGEIKSENTQLRTEVQHTIKKMDVMRKEMERLQQLVYQKDEIIKERDVTIEQINQDIERFSGQIDELIGALVGIAQQDGAVMPQSSSEFFSEVVLSNDKELLFGINIEQEFLRQNSQNTILYYLYACDCRIKEEFEVRNLHIRSKNDLALVGEAFADFVRVASLSGSVVLQGVIEIAPATILDNPTIRYYGNKSINDYFEEFVCVYSDQCSTEEILNPHDEREGIEQ